MYMSMKKRLWISMSLAVLGTASGCSTTSGFTMWPSGWMGTKTASPSNNLAKAARPAPLKPSSQGANAQLGSQATSATGTFSAVTASFKKWTSPADTTGTPAEDPLSLDHKVKSLSPELLVQMARMHEAKGDFPGAIRQYEEALKASPKNTDILVGLARAQDRSGDLSKAIVTYQRAIALDPKCALAYNDLGLCYARQKDMTRSRENLQKAVTLTPDSKLYRNNYATVLTESRMYHEALEQLAAVHPPAIANYNLGVLANRAGDKNEAMSRFQQAAAIDPGLAAAQRMIAKLNGVPAQPASAESRSAAALAMPALPAANQPMPTSSISQLPEQARTTQSLTQPFHAGLQSQAQQAQAGLQAQALQVQTQITDQAQQLKTQWQNQAQLQLRQVKTDAAQIQTQVGNEVQAQSQQAQAKLNDGVARTSETAQHAIRDAEAKIRAALQSQTAPLAPSYSGNWVPPSDDDITPIEAEPGGASDSPEAPRYSISDDAESASPAPVLLPPTGQ
jgi:tetratricopeptide (TPR) repeat protein